MLDERMQNNELISISNNLFVETSLFAKSLGLKVESMTDKRVSMRLKWRDRLSGSIRTASLHGGVIASVMDIAGSLAVFSNILHRMKGSSWQEKIARIKMINTIDLRIDYLRPGTGTDFLATGSILRTGKTVAVSRIELRNQEERLIAVGTGSYFLAKRTSHVNKPG